MNTETIQYLLKVRDQFSGTFKKFNFGLGRMKAKIRLLRRGMTKMGNSFVSAGKKVSGFTAPIGVAFGLAARTIYKFDESMNSVRSRMLLTSKDIKKDMSGISKKAKELGSTTQYSANEAGDAMYYLAGAGWKASTIMKNTASVLNLAAASGMGLKETADIATNIMSSFGFDASKMDAEDFAKEVKKAMDIMAAGTSRSNIDMTQLSDTMKYVGNTAKNLGVGMAEATAVTGVLGNFGIQGSLAATGMKALYTRTATNEGKLKKMGISMKDASGKALPMMKIFEQLGSKMDKMGKFERINFGKNFFGLYGMAASDIAIDNLKDVSELTKKLQKDTEGAGASLAMAQARMQGLPGATKLMTSAVAGLNLKLGDAGLTDILIFLASAVKGFSNWLAGTNKYVRGFVVGIGGILMVAGPALIAIGKMSLGISALSKVTWISKTAIFAWNTIVKGVMLTTKLWTAAQWLLNIAMAANPILLIIAGVVLLGVAVAALIYYWKDVVKWMKEAVAWASDSVLGRAVGGVVNMFSGDSSKPAVSKGQKVDVGITTKVSASQGSKIDSQEVSHGNNYKNAGAW